MYFTQSRAEKYWQTQGCWVFAAAYIKVTWGVFLEPVMQYTVMKARNQRGSCGGDYSKPLSHIKRRQQISFARGQVWRTTWEFADEIVC